MSCACGSLECNCQAVCSCVKASCFCISCYMMRENRCELCNLPCFYKSNTPPEGFCNCFLSDSLINNEVHLETENAEKSLNSNCHARAYLKKDGRHLPTLSVDSSREVRLETHCKFQNDQTGEVSNKLDILDCQAKSNDQMKESQLPVISLEETNLVTEQLPQNSERPENEPLRPTERISSGSTSSNFSDNKSTYFNSAGTKTTGSHFGRDGVSNARKFTRGIYRNMQSSTSPREMELIRVTVRPSFTRPPFSNSPYYVPSTRGTVVSMDQEFAPPPISTVVPPFYRRTTSGQNPNPHSASWRPQVKAASNSRKKFPHSHATTQHRIQRPNNLNYPHYAVRSNVVDWIDKHEKYFNCTSVQPVIDEDVRDIANETEQAGEALLDVQKGLERDLMDTAKSSEAPFVDSTGTQFFILKEYSKTEAENPPETKSTMTPDSYNCNATGIEIPPKTADVTSFEGQHDLLESSNISVGIQETHLDDDDSSDSM